MDRKQIASFVVKQLGGPSMASRHFGVTPQAVNNWLHRSGIPYQQIRSLRRYDPSLLPEEARNA